MKHKNDDAHKHKDGGFLFAFKMTFKVMDRKDKLQFALLCLSSLFVGFAMLIPTQLLAVIVSKITGDPLVFLWFTIPQNTEFVTIILVCGAGALVAGMAQSYLTGLSWVYAERVSVKISQRAFSWIIVPRKNLDIKMTQGDACYRINNAPNNINWMLSNLFNEILPHTFGGIMAIIYICVIDVMSLPILIAGGIVIVLMVTVRTKIEKPYSSKMEKEKSRLNNFVNNAIENLPIINIFASQKHELGLHAKKTDDYLKTYKKAGRIWIWYWTIMPIVEIGCIYSIILVCSARISNGTLLAASIVVIINYVVQAFKPIQHLGWFYGQVVQAGEKAKRVLAMQAKAEDIIDTTKDIEVEGPITKIQLKNVSVRNSEDILIKNINFTLSRGQLAVLIGTSGGGKTTALRALCGISELESGKIVINDKITVNSMYSYINRFSVVMQSPNIFNRNVIDNILYPAVPLDDTASHQIANLEMSEVAKRLYDEDCEQNLENMLSGGEKKRICVLRGLLQNSEVYIFDEPTNELDSKNTQRVLNDINKLKENAIVLVITHDKRMIEKADKVIEMRGKDEIYLINQVKTTK